MRLGVRSKLFLWTLLLVVAAEALAGIYLERALREGIEEQARTELRREARVGAEFVGGGAADLDHERGDELADRISAAVEARVTIVDGEGTVRGDSSLDGERLLAVENHADRPEIQDARRVGVGFSVRHSSTLRQDMVYVAVPTTDGEGVVRVARPLNELAAAQSQLRFSLFVAGFLALGLAAFVAGVLLTRWSRERATLESLVVRMRPDDPPGSPDAEGGSYSRIAERLEQTVGVLAAERDRFETLIESMDEAIIGIDGSATVIAANRAAHQLLQLQGDPTGKALIEMTRVPQLGELARAALEGEASSLEFDLNTTPVRRVLVRATPQGTGTGGVLVVHDVTEVRRLETVRRDFVANVSHELRTPVSVIQANAETLLSGAVEDPEQARRFLEPVRRNAERLGRLIADLLDISRIEAGKYELGSAPVSLSRLAAAAAKATAEACKDRRVELVVEVDDDAAVRGDSRALEQILVNFVENAVKYGPEDSRVWVRSRSEGAAIRLEVVDEGPGIEARHRARVFERFYRVDPGRSRNMGGTGLGLAIVKNLAEAMGGEVGVEPREPHGSIFWMRLAAATEKISEEGSSASV